MDEQRHGKAGELPLTAEEKAGLCIGADFWHVRGVPRLGLKGIMVADGPHGLAVVPRGGLPDAAERVPETYVDNYLGMGLLADDVRAWPQLEVA